MAISSNIATGSAKRLVGDPRELARTLGSPRELAELGAALAPAAEAEWSSLPGLRRFLEDYISSVLIPVELPIVRKVFEHACRGEIAELIALDQNYKPPVPHPALSLASRQLGRRQLRRLRPLRGERRVQRYWRAVQRGEAHGWHTVVYGLALAVFSLPLRQGILSFGAQTLRGFILATRERAPFQPEDCSALEREFAEKLVRAVDDLFSQSNGPPLLALP